MTFFFFGAVAYICASAQMVLSSRDFGVEQFFVQMAFEQMTHLHYNFKIFRFRSNLNTKFQNFWLLSFNDFK
jgi:hypothetical protein